MSIEVLKAGVVLAVVCAITSPLVAGESASPPVPASNPGEWVNASDYPAWALRSGATGVVRFEVHVLPSGEVEECRIVLSSGVPDLDLTACEKIKERAKFLPARNDAGEAIAGKWQSAVRWELPRPRTTSIPKPYEVVMSLTVEKDGTVSGCTVSGLDDASATDLICKSQPQFEPKLNGEGVPVRAIVRRTTAISVEELGD